MLFIKQAIERAIAEAAQKGELDRQSSADVPILLERPHLATHGDYACDAPLKLASRMRISALRVAEIIVDHMELAESDVRVQIEVPGFINFHLNDRAIQQALLEIHQKGSSFGTKKKTSKISIGSRPGASTSLTSLRVVLFAAALSALFQTAGYEAERQAQHPDILIVPYDLKGDEPLAQEIIHVQAVSGESALSQLGPEEIPQALRYYLLELAANQPVTIDGKLLKTATRANKAFHIQYACARIQTAIRHWTEVCPGRETEPYLAPPLWREALALFPQDAKVFAPAFEHTSPTYPLFRAISGKLHGYPLLIEEATRYRNPGRVARFAFELAESVHQILDSSPLPSDKVLAALGVLIAARIVLATAMELCGMKAIDSL